MKMQIAFYASDNKDQELSIAEGFRKGAALRHDNVEIIPTSHFPSNGVDPRFDVACFFGVKGHSRAIMEAYLDAGKRTLMFDKAIIRPVLGAPHGYYRVSIDQGDPSRHMMRVVRTFERWEKLGIQFAERQPADEDGRGAIIFAGSSQKYCDWYGLGDANDYAESILVACHDHAPKRRLVYRPKPSFTGYRAIYGARLSKEESLADCLRGAHCLITHGSSAAIDAIVRGVPAITLGPCAAKFICGRSVEDVRSPPWPSEAAKFQWASNLAWFQWTVPEMASGEMWTFLRRELRATAHDE